jgi:hypothetical protein
MILRLKAKLVELFIAIAMLSHPVDPHLSVTWRMRRF